VDTNQSFFFINIMIERVPAAGSFLGGWKEGRKAGRERGVTAGLNRVIVLG
jgi:hypothetical protein